MWVYKGLAPLSKFRTVLEQRESSPATKKEKSEFIKDNNYF